MEIPMEGRTPKEEAMTEQGSGMTNEEIADELSHKLSVDFMYRNKLKRSIKEALDTKDSEILDLKEEIGRLKYVAPNTDERYMELLRQNEDLRSENERLKGGYCCCAEKSHYRLFHRGGEIIHGDCGKILSPRDKEYIQRGL